MKNLFLLGLLVLVPAYSIQAQMVDVTLIGTVQSTMGYDATVFGASGTNGSVPGSAITINFEFNAADAVTSPPSATSVGEYTFGSMGSATSTDTFGDYVLTQTNNSTVEIFSNAQGDYGYLLLSADAANEGGDFVELVSNSTPAVAPSTALGSLQTFPISDFNAGAIIEIENDAAASGADSGVADLSALISSYTVTVVPEPSTYALLGAGLLALAALKLSRKKVSV